MMTATSVFLLNLFFLNLLSYSSSATLPINQTRRQLANGKPCQDTVGEFYFNGELTDCKVSGLEARLLCHSPTGKLFCPVSCNVCAADSPTPSPSQAPVARRAPGSRSITMNAQTSVCEDSVEMFRWYNGLAVDCDWVNRSPEKTCKVTTARKECPRTCGLCPSPNSPSVAIVPGQGTTMDMSMPYVAYSMRVLEDAPIFF